MNFVLCGCLIDDALLDRGNNKTHVREEKTFGYDILISNEVRLVMIFKDVRHSSVCCCALFCSPVAYHRELVTCEKVNIGPRLTAAN